MNAAPSPAEILVVTVVYNPGAELRTFAETLQQATGRRYSLVVVNNGLDSPLIDEVATTFGATVLRHPEGNVGYGRAANYGVQHSPEPAWIVVSNPDIEWAPGSLDALVDAGEACESAGSLGPRILNEDGTVYPSARALPSLKNGIGHALLHKVWPSNPWTRRYRQYEAVLAATEPTPTGWLSGACLLLRPAAFAALGGFDEGYFMFFEDVDLGDRLGRAGWQNLYVPAAEVTHVQGVSWKRAPARMIRAHHASARKYLFDRWTAWWQQPLHWIVGAGLWVREQIAVFVARTPK